MLYFILTILLLNLQDNKAEISFGSGGGFAGISKDYTLDTEGNLFKVNVFTDERTLLKKTDKGQVEHIFQLINEGKFQDFNLDEPGNTYKYIEIKDANGSHKLVWSGISANKNLNLLYKELNAIR